MNPEPSTTAPNGNDHAPDGRFAKGNHAAIGNPHAQRVAQLRSLLFSAVSDEDLKAIVAKVVEQAKAGDMAAAREVLDRCLGKSVAAVNLDVSGPPHGFTIAMVMAAMAASKPIADDQPIRLPPAR